MDQLHQVDSDKAIVIYHANCMDGFASAWAFHILKDKEYPQKVEYYPCQYGEDPVGKTEYSGRDLYIVDFSFDRSTLTTLATWANKVLVLDHHKTAKEALTNWEDKPSNLHIVFDMDRSGAGLTWDWFGYQDNDPLKKVPRPRLINFVEDRDLWRFNLPWSKEINAVVAVTTKDFPAYTNLNKSLELQLIDVANTGKYLNTQFEKLVKEIADDSRECIITDQSGNRHSGLCSNCSPQFSSEVGNVLATKSGTFGATYYSNKNGEVKWSLRSVGDFDVRRLAESFGGGGHKNASGFVLHDLGQSTDSRVNLWAGTDLPWK